MISISAPVSGVAIEAFAAGALRADAFLSARGASLAFFFAGGAASGDFEGIFSGSTGISVETAFLPPLLSDFPLRSETASVRGGSFRRLTESSPSRLIVMLYPVYLKRSAARPENRGASMPEPARRVFDYRHCTREKSLTAAACLSTAKLELNLLYYS
jgi:hypothetical protein